MRTEEQERESAERRQKREKLNEIKEFYRSKFKADPAQIRCVIKNYYEAQRKRVRESLQIFQRKRKESETDIMEHFRNATLEVERSQEIAIEVWAEDSKLAQWAMQVDGVGPLLAAGLCAYLDVERAPTAGHFWRIAGLDPSRTWVSAKDSADWMSERKGRPIDELVNEAAEWIRVKPETLLRMATTGKEGETVKLTRATLERAICRRPHNATLKTICWKIGESFNKLPESHYGIVLRNRKVYEHEKNERGEYAEQAARVLKRAPNHAQKSVYKQGKLPDGHIHARAKRYAVKLFLAEFHAEAYRQKYGCEPPLPYHFPDEAISKERTIRAEPSRVAA